MFFSCKIRMKVSFIETRTRIFVYQFRVSIRLLCLPNCTYIMLCHITHAMPLLINSVVSLQMWVLTGRQDIPLKVTSSSSLPIANFSEMLPATPSPPLFGCELQPKKSPFESVQWIVFVPNIAQVPNPYCIV